MKTKLTARTRYEFYGLKWGLYQRLDYTCHTTHARDKYAKDSKAKRVSYELKEVREMMIQLGNEKPVIIELKDGHFYYVQMEYMDRTGEGFDAFLRYNEELKGFMFTDGSVLMDDSQSIVKVVPQENWQPDTGIFSFTFYPEKQPDNVTIR